MFTSNLPYLERLIRVVLGLAIAVYGAFFMAETDIFIAVAGACVALTGLIGYCPACALAGRGRPRG